ncbi:uncharacterized protein N7503_005001 [Penicillium pulvis]|uniref:uncharacterized protein n=1 Tax=Penicillium pulvis TaxID=1562058 RepID=UPI002547AB06|nr:uncharacterized protein N7503_005001 [Penicillium pulvis]KAJ5802551.1 hypothetical protein N7503_005001 [Penicillium pulvis]
MFKYAKYFSYHVIKTVGVRAQGTWMARGARQILEWIHARRDADWPISRGIPKVSALLDVSSKVTSDGPDCLGLITSTICGQGT